MVHLSDAKKSLDSWINYCKTQRCYEELGDMLDSVSWGPERLQRWMLNFTFLVVSFYSFTFNTGDSNIFYYYYYYYYNYYYYYYLILWVNPKDIKQWSIMRPLEKDACFLSYVNLEKQNTRN